MKINLKINPKKKRTSLSKPYEPKFLNPIKLKSIISRSLVSAKLIRATYTEENNALTLIFKHRIPSSLESFEELSKDLGVHVSALYVMPKSPTDLAITVSFEDQTVNLPDGDIKL
jgi:hypothetical protein